MKRQRFRRHANPFSMPKAISVPDWQSIYERRAPMALDIGFGQGEFILSLAQKHPQWNVLGIEIREHLVENLLTMAQEAECSNLHALVANANIHLETLIPNHCLEFVSINFPDPWFKRRHHKRRVLSKDWLVTLLKKVRPGA
ncbi:MAG: tRNA (guanosine(46)-N7)-methyltransferase TrmB, partial [Myxococcota bacterium]|nr:tRNA (guanosine(46)-N7)-methyltransferase TrmB [Myxococcota bacterium]